MFFARATARAHATTFRGERAAVCLRDAGRHPAPPVYVCVGIGIGTGYMYASEQEEPRPAVAGRSPPQDGRQADGVFRLRNAQLLFAESGDRSTA